MAATSSRDVWAVGPPKFADVSQRLVIVRWDGQRLTSTFPFNFPAGLADLSAVAAHAPNDVWAVGSHTGKPLVAHWDGIRWRMVRVRPLKGIAALTGIAALSRANVWALGYREDASSTA